METSIAVAFLQAPMGGERRPRHLPAASHDAEKFKEGHRSHRRLADILRLDDEPDRPGQCVDGVAQRRGDRAQLRIVLS